MRQQDLLSSEKAATCAAMRITAVVPDVTDWKHDFANTKLPTELKRFWPICCHKPKLSAMSHPRQASNMHLTARMLKHKLQASSPVYRCCSISGIIQPDDVYQRRAAGARARRLQAPTLYIIPRIEYHTVDSKTKSKVDKQTLLQ